jgi:sigma-B regulation protein RsbU (phosphoserine phosphatase)
MSILPKMLPPFPHHESFNLFATIAPAKEVGGDFYDFFEIDDAHLGLVIADASGKGVPASLFMAVAKTLIKATARVDRSPAEILGEVNDELSRNNDQSMFITVFFAILDLRSGELRYANAGHNPPLLIGRAGAPSYLPRTGQLVLGAMEDYRYRCDTLTLTPGDRLFLYTDGVTEAMDENGEQYSEQGLLATLTGQPPCAIDALTGAAIAAVKQFAGAAPQSDDITIMVVEYLGAPKLASVEVATGDHHSS